MAITQQTQTADMEQTTDDVLTVEGDERRRVATEAGVRIWSASVVGGAEACRFTLIEWGEHEEIKQCPSCEEFHNANNPTHCFGCAMGLK